MSKNVTWIILILGVCAIYTSCKKTEYLGVGFYNVENLFDTIDDPRTFDGEYLPDSFRQWNTDRYFNKLNQLAKVITSFENEKTPDFLGLCEVENRLVIEDLLKTDALKDKGYEIVHYESSDVRGIDVAGIYKPSKLTLIESGKQWVNLSEYGEITRDILWVKMKSNDGSIFYFLVNHWPSRRGGLAESEPKRMIAATALKMLKDSLLELEPTANLVVMGDFNDEPDNKSILETLGTSGDANKISNTQLFNAMSALNDAQKGSYCFRGTWNMLDQIMINDQLLDNKSWEYTRNSAKIMDYDWLKQQDGNYKGFPLRTFGGKNYLAGYSDHFPVSVVLQYQQ